MVTKAWRAVTVQAAVTKHPGDSMMGKLPHSPWMQHNSERILSAPAQKHGAQGLSKKNSKTVQSFRNLWPRGDCRDVAHGAVHDAVLWQTATSSGGPDQGCEAKYGWTRSWATLKLDLISKIALSEAKNSPRQPPDAPFTLNSSIILW